MTIDGIRKVCVVGAGTMGAGIAAQIANAGVSVLLLDMVPDTGSDRDALANLALARLLTSEPPAFMSGRAAELVQTGNIDDDLDRVWECDWIVEAVTERLEIKQALYERLERLKRPGAAVSSNTSTIPLDRLVDGRSAQFRGDFFITHFFNPPRYMRLLEIVASDVTNPAILGRIADFGDRHLGKKVVRAKDRPGFIANRIGVYWLAVAVNSAIDLGLTVEEADLIGGRPMGVPKSGIFGLIDLIGVDLLPLLSASLARNLSSGDPYLETVRPAPLIDRMIAEGRTGRKGKGGFYKKQKGEGGKGGTLALDLATGDYRPRRNPPPLPHGAETDLWALIDAPGAAGAFAWAILGSILSYAASRVGEIAEDLVAIDEAMKSGYNWRFGPFELIDRLGPARFAERLQAEGRPVAPILKAVGTGSFYRVEAGKLQYFNLQGGYRNLVRPEGVLLLEDIKRGSEPVISNASAALWDIGEGVACFEFTTKMNVLDEQTMQLLEASLSVIHRGFKAMIVYNEAGHFSAGANLSVLAAAIRASALQDAERLFAAGQRAYKLMKYSPFPVVGAPSGMALGGGCELLLHCDAIQAHAESYIGLVETSVGLLPGWSGCSEMLDRVVGGQPPAPQPMAAVMKAFETISEAKVSQSAAEARGMMILRSTDCITMNRDRLLADAKARALTMAQSYEPPRKPIFNLPGKSGRLAFADFVSGRRRSGPATEYDEIIARRLAVILTGGDSTTGNLTEDQMLALERQQLMECVRDIRTLERIDHMLQTGKRLRN